MDGIDDCNCSSIWINSDLSEELCKDIQIKFACGCSAAGYISISYLYFDIRIIRHNFIAVPMKCLGINGWIDHRNKEEVYVCMQHDVEQLHF